MKRLNRGWLFGGILGAFVCGGGLYASPYLTLYQMYQAAERNDVQGVAAFVDFPVFRESVKTNLRTLVAHETTQTQNPLMGLLGTAISGFVLDPVVDSVVTPSGVAALLEGQRLQLGQNSEPAQFSPKADNLDVKAQYESFNQFAVSVKPKNESGEPITLLLSRDGLSWKVSGVRIPSSAVLAKELLPKSAMPDLNDIGDSAAEILKGLI